MSAPQQPAPAAGAATGVAVTTSNALHITPFIPGETSWARWLNRFEGALKIMKIENSDKVVYLLHFVGDTAYNALCDTFGETQVDQKSYAELAAKLKELYAPPVLEIAENFKFNSRKQLPGESIQEFATALTKMSANCGFGAHTSKALRNQFVFGLATPRIQSRLIETKDLTFESALSTALTMDTCDRETSCIRDSASAVNYLNAQKKRSDASKKKKIANSAPKQQVPPVDFTKPYCFRCGNPNHKAFTCRLPTSTVCLSCQKPGHLSRVCKSKFNQVHQVENTEYTDEDYYGVEIVDIQIVDSEDVNCLALREKFIKQFIVNNQKVEFELDSGAAVSLMWLEDAKKLFPRSRLQRASIQLVTYCKTNLNVRGLIKVIVTFENTKFNLDLYLTDVNRPPLCGREWIHSFIKMHGAQSLFTPILQVNAKEISSFDKTAFTKELSVKYKNVVRQDFSPIIGLGLVSLKLKPDAKPVFYKARNVPFRLVEPVDSALDNWESYDILEPVPASLYATPIVPILKKDGDVRICGDYSVTINPQLIINDCHMPTTDEMFMDLAGCICFARIDCSWAYIHMPVDEATADLLTINTPRGLYRVKRMLFGIAAAPAIWQERMNFLFRSIKGVCVFQDDLRLAAKTLPELIALIHVVLKIFDEHNIKINLRKCSFCDLEICFCGHVINAQGIHKDPAKFEAVTDMPQPQNISELRTFIGMVMYYNRFIKNASTVLAPLYNLLKENSNFSWTKECQDAFESIKLAFTKDTCLTFFDPKKPLILATDASPVGVGAVISHSFEDGTERPIQFASQKLNKVQQKYSQIDREAYAIVFGVKKFYQYLYGHKFTLICDNRPLVQIFSPNKPLPAYSAMRMQHYAIFLRGFFYDIKYRRSESNSNADCLSRLPLAMEGDTPHTLDVIEVYHAQTLHIMSVDVFDMRELVKNDAKIQSVIENLRAGKNLSPKDTWNVDPREFSVEDNLLFKSDRIVIPKKLQQRILEELHVGHFGIVKMKSLARGHCWWSNIDKDIENLVQSCESCLRNRNNPAKVPIHLWEPATRPFERIHIDFAGPFMGAILFILVDAYSKWPEIRVVKNMLASTTIDVCTDIFAQFGFPEVLVSDNGGTYISSEFESFLKLHGIAHKFSAPHHPASNGQAERFVQMIKFALKKVDDKKNVNASLRKILIQYRNTPHSTTGKTPAELFLGRKIRCKLDLLKPVVAKEQATNVKACKFSINQRVLVRNYTKNNKWVFGRILEHRGNLLFKIKLDDGRIWIRHANQISAIKGTLKQCNDYDYFVPVSEHVSLYEPNNASASVPTTNATIVINEPDASSDDASNSRPKRKTKGPTRFPDSENYFGDKSS
ncbi:uncharacterized protein K02A2.6-like [Neodiprion virginianus]|uniref:uncharacterized protein K02A2.6-like n=1 Tax=Neodiprion virginianus TaxID=2961670 RepID=UPI001EE6C75C|nr:uncharacterized protein K02A2.6-like [Neodiprion virginianus]